MRDVALADFAGRVGEDFEVEVEGQRLVLRLEGATELAGSPRPSGGFQLEFSGPGDPMLAQGLFPFVHDGESFDLFVVPIGRDARGARYDVTFF